MSSLPTPPTGFTELAGAADRERILAAAQVLYLQHGIAAVAMADIARHLGLPESRVVRFFPSKEPLIWAVVDEFSYALYEQLIQHKEHSSNAVEELLALRDFLAEQAALTNAAFFQELAADHPTCQERWLMHLASFSAEHLRHNLRWGMLQELYHANLDAEALVQQVMQQQNQYPSVLIAKLVAHIVTPAGALLVQQLASPPAAI